MLINIVFACQDDIVLVANPDQVEQNIGGVGWEIPNNDFKVIYDILEERRC
jgi:hypothetical protein